LVNKEQLSSENTTGSDSSCCSNAACCPPKIPMRREMAKIGRNDPCPCGNGRKFKKCCGQQG